VPFLPDAESLFHRLFSADPAAFWLDSSMVRQGLSRFSFMGGSST
jgi:para-aminobenzoate synthetase